MNKNKLVKCLDGEDTDKYDTYLEFESEDVGAEKSKAGF